MKIKLYFITALSLMMFSFNSFAVTDAECKSRPRLPDSPLLKPIYYPQGTSIDNGIGHYYLYDGCVYDFTIPYGSTLVYHDPIAAFSVDSSGGNEGKELDTDGKVPDSQGTGTGLDNTGSGSGGKGDSGSDTAGTSETGNTGSSTGGTFTTPESPSSSDSGTSSGDASSEPITPVDISGISTPFSKPVPVPDIVVNGSGIRELVDSFERCKSISRNMPSPDRTHYNPFVTTAYNSVVDSCNAIYDQMSAVLQENEVNSPLDNNQDFYTKDNYGAVFHCKDNNMSFGYLKLTKLSYPNRCTVNSDGSTDCSFSLNMNFGGSFSESYVNKVCSDAYSAFLSSGDANKNDDNSGADVASGADGKPTDSSVVNPTVDKGQGGGNISSDFTPPSPATGDNADVVNAINSLHRDANIKSDGLSNQIKGNQSELLNKLDSNNKELIDTLKNTNGNDNKDVIDAMNNNHQELMDSINKVPDVLDYDANETGFGSQIEGEMNGLGDSIGKLYDESISSLDDMLSQVDKLIPEIKTSFDLPPQFVSASQGRCIPLVLDFDIQLIGIPNYHFHGEGTQVCRLYDEHVRPVLNFILIVLTIFTVRRVLLLSAEFLTESK